MTLSLKLAVTLVLSQYVRTKTDETNLKSQCLWWMGETTIVFHQSELGEPTVSGETEFAAVTASYATWQKELISCGSLTLSEGSRTKSRAIGYVVAAENENVVLFRATKCEDLLNSDNACWKDSTCGNSHDCWEHSSSAIAITSTSYTPASGRDLDSDIELNSPSFLFTTGVPVITDVQNTVTHEVGHLLGLAHINLDGSTMNAKAESGELRKRTLDTGSKQFICDVYPKGKPTKTCQIPVLTSSLGASAKAGCSTADTGVLAGLAALTLAMRVRRRRA